MLRMRGGRHVLARKDAAVFVAEAVVPLEDDDVGMDFLGQPDEGGHFAEVRALHDEGEREADRGLGIEEEIAADALYASTEAIAPERSGLAQLSHGLQVLAENVPTAGPPDVLVGFLRGGVDGDAKLDDLLREVRHRGPDILRQAESIGQQEQLHAVERLMAQRFENRSIVPAGEWIAP